MRSSTRGLFGAVPVLIWSAMALLACPSPSSPDGGASDGGASDGGPSDSGASGTDGFARYADAYCTYQVRCGLWEPSLKGECVDLYRHVVDSAPYERGIERGAIAVDESRLTECITRLTGTESCTAGGCSPSPFAPKVANGDSCLWRWECAEDDAFCSGEVTCGRTCTPFGGLAQPCKPDTSPSCAAGLTCDSTTTTCVPLPAAGEPCAASAGCGLGLYCDATTEKCFAPPAVGQACAPTYPPCAPSAYCSNGVCVARQGRGERCLPQTCASGLYCDAVLRTCEGRSTGWDEGVSCTDDVLKCGTSFVCRGASINLDGGVGVTGTCDPRQLGESCTSGSQCSTQSTCIGGACAAARTAAPCVADFNCLQKDYCGQDNTCKTYVALGEPCSADTKCHFGAVCANLPTEPAVYRCRALASSGDACGSTVGFASPVGPCRSPLECRDGHCAHTGGAGEPCFGGLCFFTGACRGADGGLAPWPAGMCGAKVPEGGACFSDGSCESGWCDSVTRTCARPCP